MKRMSKKLFMKVFYKLQRIIHRKVGDANRGTTTKCGALFCVTRYGPDCKAVRRRVNAHVFPVFERRSSCAGCRSRYLVQGLSKL